LIHFEQIEKDLIEIVLKLTEMSLFLCTVYERRLYCAQGRAACLLLPAACMFIQHGYNGNPLLRRFFIFILPFLRKMQFFKISVRLCFSVDLLFFFFFCGELVEAIAGPIYMKIGTNMSSCV